MELDYKKLAEEKTDALVQDLKKLIGINSVRDMSRKSKEYPVGPGPVKALRQFLAFAQRDGFIYRNIDNYIGEIDFGQGDETIGIACHTDVVPAGNGWRTDPFKAVIKDGKVYGRGSTDNKGPSLAAYYALLILKEAGFKPKKKIAFLLGTDEETDWTGMKYYLKHEPEIDDVFSPDDRFPLLNSEFGLAVLTTKFTQPEKSGDYDLLSFKAGSATNTIPASATAIVAGEKGNLQAAFQEFLDKEKLQGRCSYQNGNFQFYLQGRASHASIPQKGRNAATYLALFLDQLNFAGRGKDYLDFLRQVEHRDFYGEKLGIAVNNPKMGRLTNAASVYEYEQGGAAWVRADIRYPEGTRPEKMAKILNEKFGSFSKTTYQPYQAFELPHYVPIDNPFVQKLLKAYEEQTGKKGHGMVSGGATYGRMFKNGVAFGSLPEGEKDCAHATDEYVEIKDLTRAMAIYARAIYELTK